MTKTPGITFSASIIALIPEMQPRITPSVYFRTDRLIVTAGVSTRPSMPRSSPEAARLLRSGIRIDHDFACSPEERRRKNLWYIEILNEELAQNPSDYSRLDFLAAEYHQLEMFDQAAEIAERIATVRPLDPQAHLHAGVYHLIYKHDPERARVDFLEALRLRPQYPEAQSFLELIESQAPSQINCN